MPRSNRPRHLAPIALADGLLSRWWFEDHQTSLLSPEMKEPDHIYILESCANIHGVATHLIKVGMCGDPWRRLRELKAADPQGFFFHFVAMVKNGTARQIEKHAHTALSSHRRSGEWFAVSPSDAIGKISEVARKLDAELCPVDVMMFRGFPTPEECAAARLELNWKVRDLCERSGIGERAVRMFESKQTRLPHQSTLESIKSAFNKVGKVFDERES